MEEGVSEIKEEGENEMTLSVLNPRKLRNYLMKGFRFVHIGHLDVTVTPLTRMNLNTSILVCVVDYRHNQFEQALIAAVEAALDKGKVTFFLSPNLTLSLTERHLNQALRLHTKTKGFDMLEGSVNIALSWKLCYRVYKTLSPMVRNRSSFHGFYPQEDVEGRILTPQRVKPNEVLIPRAWSLKYNEKRPSLVAPRSDYVRDKKDGTIQLSLRNDDKQGNQTDEGPSSPKMIYPRRSISMMIREEPQISKDLKKEELEAEYAEYLNREVRQPSLLSLVRVGLAECSAGGRRYRSSFNPSPAIFERIRYV